MHHSMLNLALIASSALPTQQVNKARLLIFTRLMDDGHSILWRSIYVQQFTQL